MSIAKRLAAAGFAAALALSGAAAVGAVSPAVAAPQAPAVAPAPSAAAAAGTWLAGQIQTDNYGDPGATIDAALGLMAAGGHDAELAAITSYLQANAATYAAKNAGSAAKLAIFAEAAHLDPTSFGGVNLLTAVKASTDTYPFSVALEAIALERAGVAIPAALRTAMLQPVSAYTSSYGDDLDSAGLMVTALQGIAATDAQAKAAEADLVAWLQSKRAADGSWPGWVPVNTTAIVGAGLAYAGQDVSASVAWLAKQQLASGALPNSGQADVMATAQGLFLLGGVNYATATWTRSAVTPSPTATATTSQSAPAPTATVSGSATTAASSPVTAASNPGGSSGPGLANTGGEQGLPLAAASVGVVTVAALVAARRR